MSAAVRTLLSRVASVAAAGLLLYILDRAVVRSATATLDLPGHVALWSGHTIVALGLGLVGAVWAAVLYVAGKVPRLRAGPARASLGGLLFVLAGVEPVFLVSHALVTGDWIARQRFASAIQIGFLIACELGLFALGYVYARASETAAHTAEPAAAHKAEPAAAHTAEPAKEAAPAPAAPGWIARTAPVLPWLLLFAATLASFADAVVLPGLYTALHLFLYGASALLALLAARLFAERFLSRRGPRLWAGAAGGALLAGAIVCAAVIAPSKLSALAVGSRVAALIVPALGGPTHIISEELAQMVVPDDDARTDKDTSAAVSALLGGRRDYNVLLIIVDTLRADTLPPARGDGRPFATSADTPFLDRWLADNFRFRHAYSQASRTRRSLPPTFRSLEANEDTERVGTPLGAQVAELGMVPAAVVPQYFLLPESEQAQHLLLGFDRVTFYEKDHQEVMIDRARDLFDGLKGQRFFAWVHFYNMHDPYFANRPLSGADGTTAQRYQKSLRWLDSQMKRLIGDLDAAGLTSNTVILFTADHGENVGIDSGTGHGGSVGENEVRVPLSVRIPGQKGREIDTLAGNVDIVPTILDVAGAPPKTSHRGRSLLPVLAGADKETVPLYFENSEGDTQGVAINKQKLVHSGKGAIFHRYDLFADPTEKQDKYDPKGDIERLLRRAMLRRNPRLFADELKDPPVRKQLVTRLEEVGAEARPGPSLELLFSLAALSKDKEALAQGERIFRAARDPGVQLLAIRSLFDTDRARWTSLLLERLGEIADTPAEGPFVEGLATSGQAAFGQEFVAARLSELWARPAEQWIPWLVLVRDWKKPQALYAEPILSLLEAFPAGPRTTERSRALGLLLENAGSLSLSPDDPDAARWLSLAIRPFLDDADAKVAVMAARALGHLHDLDSSALLRQKAEAAVLDVRIRQAILYALSDIEGTGAAELVIAQGKNPLLTVDAIQILGALKDPVALPFLRDITQHHYNGYTREEARKAIKSIEGDKAKP